MGKQMATSRGAELTAANAQTAAVLVSQGNRYSGLQRKELSEEVFRAVQGDCGACLEARGVCLKAGRFFDYFVDSHNSDLSKDLTVEILIVHAIACCSNKLEKQWFDKGVELLEYGHQAMAELTVLAGLAASLCTYYVLNGLPVPKLPPACAMAPLHLATDHYVKELSFDKAEGWGPRVSGYVEGSYVEENIDAEVRQFALMPILPLAHCASSPFDFTAFLQRSDIMWAPIKEGLGTPKGRFVSRGQLELAASATAEALECDF